MPFDIQKSVDNIAQKTGQATIYPYSDIWIVAAIFIIIVLLVAIKPIWVWIRKNFSKIGAFEFKPEGKQEIKPHDSPTSAEVAKAMSVDISASKSALYKKEFSAMMLYNNQVIDLKFAKLNLHKTIMKDCRSLSQNASNHIIQILISNLHEVTKNHASALLIAEIKLVYNPLMISFMTTVERNHFLEMSSDEFDAYIKSCFNYFLSILIDNCDLGDSTGMFRKALDTCEKELYGIIKNLIVAFKVKAKFRLDSDNKIDEELVALENAFLHNL